MCGLSSGDDDAEKEEMVLIFLNVLQERKRGGTTKGVPIFCDVATSHSVGYLPIKPLCIINIAKLFANKNSPHRCGELISLLMQNFLEDIQVHRDTHFVQRVADGKFFLCN